MAYITVYPSRIEYRTAAGVHGEFAYQLGTVLKDEFALLLGKAMRLILSDLPESVTIRYENWED